MEIKRVGSQPSVKGPAEWFTGAVRIDPLFQAPAPALLQGAVVTFEQGRGLPGTRILSARLSSSRPDAAGRSVRADQLRRSGPAMWCGSLLVKSTGTERRLQPE